MKEVYQVFGTLILNRYATILRDGCIILKITEIAKGVSRTFYKDREKVLSKIQDWYDKLPEVGNGDTRKKVYSGGENYVITPGKGMHHFYGHFDKERKSGGLITVSRLK